MTRYQMLREAVAILAAPSKEQVDYLDRIFIKCTGGGSAAAYGNDELALGLDDTFIATDHMMGFGEISANEVSAIKPLNDHFLAYWQPEDATFWNREALFDDPRWQDVRALARAVLNQLPDEKRESEYTRSLENETNGS